MVPAGVALSFCPTPLVRLPCGSTSTSRTRRSESARDAARLMVVVVLPTPPFWLAVATILAILGLVTKYRGLCSGRPHARAEYGGARKPVNEILTKVFHVKRYRATGPFARAG